MAVDVHGGHDRRPDIIRMGAELDRRAKLAATLEGYVAGRHPVPEAVTKAKATRAYQRLMGMGRSNWPRLIVGSTLDRLGVQGINVGTDRTRGSAIWAALQACDFDAEEPLATQGALTTGRAFVIVWTGADNTTPELTVERSSTVIVEYEPGSRRRRRAALRRWWDGGYWWATLYYPDALYKFRSERRTATRGVAPSEAGQWEPFEVDGESWPLPNPLRVVPVVELPVNRVGGDSPFGHAWGEFEDSLGHIDRINYTVFSGLVAMTWSGFPLRALIGDPILRDDDGRPLAPFDVTADALVQIENPDGKLQQLPESDLLRYIQVADGHIRHLAAITRTPAHYLLGELVNLSADAIRAAEASLLSKARSHQRFLGAGWREVARLVHLILWPGVVPGPITVDWADLESRSLAERADAAVKLAPVLPWQALARRVLGASPAEIDAWSAMRAAEGLNGLLIEQPTADGRLGDLAAA